MKQQLSRCARLRAGAVFLCLILTLSLLGGCAQEQQDTSTAGTGVPAAQQSQSTEEFILPYSSAEGFNPYVAQSSITLQNSRLVFGSLVQITNDFELEYEIARSVVSVGNTVEITVEGSFADGTAITGADVAACIEAARTSAVFGGRFSKVQSVRASGNLVTVTLSEPDSLFAYLLDIPVIKASEVGQPARPPAAGIPSRRTIRGHCSSRTTALIRPRGWRPSGWRNSAAMMRWSPG